MSNIEQTKDGLIEKSSGRKIESPLDYVEKSNDVLSALQSAIGSLRHVTLYSSQINTREQCQEMIEALQDRVDAAVKARILFAKNSDRV